MMSALVVDDEALAARRLEVALTRNRWIERVATASGVDDALAALDDGGADVVFLDIEMPGRGGFELVAELSGRDRAPDVIFVTAFSQHAVRAFDHAAVDYLLKPVSAVRLDEAIDRVRARREDQAARGRCLELERVVETLRTQTGQEETLRDFWVRARDRRVRVPCETIQRIEAVGDYVLLHTPDASHIIRKTMTELEKELDPGRFIRIHRSHIVNTQAVTAFVQVDRGRYEVRLRDTGPAPVGRSYLLQARARFQ